MYQKNNHRIRHKKEQQDQFEKLFQNKFDDIENGRKNQSREKSFCIRS